MKTKNNKCLLLNADFTPFSIIPWKKAITWQAKYDTDPNFAVNIIDFYKDDWILCPNNEKIPVPAVARKIKFHKSRGKSVPFSRKNIFTRDNFTCQFCGVKFYDLKDLSYDHVIPKVQWDYAHGSPTTWTNITTACIPCNRKKAGRTPKQAGMTLLTMPFVPNKEPKYLPVTYQLIKMNRDNIPEEWLLYLPEAYRP